MSEPVLRRRRRSWLLALCLPALSTLPIPAVAFEPADVILHQPGSLPLVVTAPHDGDLPLGLTPTRTRGTQVRDLGTGVLAEQVAKRLEARLGQRPCLVVARFSRRFVDANRPEADALESDIALPAYRAYHAAVASCVARARAQHPQGALLVDVHGQGQVPDVLFRGTRAGLTTQALLARHGPAALQGPESLIGQLAARGYIVHPAVGTDSLREDPRYAGGYTVFTYGSQHPDGIDAIQLEFGAQQRRSPQLTDDVADALLVFLTRHGYLPKP
ncbi:MAG: N-formylglutamate amidohydrolase [Aquabacterium sp.]|nr:N-formylglutamate amidohydrolase [Aquabacterium sp.]